MMIASGGDFTRDVAKYDAWYHTPWGGYAESEELRLLVEMARPQHGERALDVGCGTGRMLARMLSLCVDAHGTEPAPDMREVAQWRLEQLGHDPERVVDASVEALPFEEHVFDVVTAITELEFVVGMPRALKEMARVCRGRIFIEAINARSIYGAAILRGEAGETRSRARLQSPEALEALVQEQLRPERIEVRTTLIGGRTEDSLELAVQRRLDRRLRDAQWRLGGVIALVAEVQT